MATIENAALRRKIGDGKGVRPPLRDPDYACEMFARIFEERLRSTFRKPTKVAVVETEVRRYGDVIRDLESDALLGLASLNDKGFAGILPLDPAFVFSLIETMSGADPRDGAAGERALTSIDEALSEDFVDDVFICFEAAIAPPRGDVVKGALRFDKFLKNPSSILDVEEEMEMFSIRISISLGSVDEPRELTLNLPLNVLDYYKAAEIAAQAATLRIAARPEPGAPSALWSRAMLKAANEASYPVTAVLSQFEITLQEIGELGPGSVLPLPSLDGLTADLRFNLSGDLRRAPTIAVGAVGAHGDNRALKIIEEPDDMLIETLSRFKL